MSDEESPNTMDEKEAQTLLASLLSNDELDRELLVRLLGLVDEAVPASLTEDNGPQKTLLLPMISPSEQAAFHDALYRALYRQSIATQTITDSVNSEKSRG